MRLFPLLFVLGLLLAGCAGPTKTPEPSVEPPPPPPTYSFHAPVALPPGADGVGSEPSILASRKDGAIYAVSVLGSATARGDGLWKSTDGGKNFAYLGKPDYPFGGGDADLDEDDAGTLYLPGQWRPAAIPGYYVTGGESMAVSTDGGATWTINPVASNAPVTDRQWTATHGTGNVWLAFNQAQRGLVVTKSTDSGKTWTSLTAIEGTWEPGDGVAFAGGPNGIPGDWLVDPTDGRLYLPYGPGIGSGARDHRLFISSDGGATFNRVVIHTVAEGKQGSAIFGSLARDDNGTLYYVWSEGNTEGMTVYLARSFDRGMTWTKPMDISPTRMTAIFPWIVAGAKGRVAVAYYGAEGGFVPDDAPENATWFPFVTFLDGADGDRPIRSTVLLSATPNHKGRLCTGGSGCDPAFRQLGDFFEIGLTKEAKVVAVWVDDTSPNGRANRVAVQDAGSLR